METVTSLTLLEGLQNTDNRPAWLRFNERYRPMVVGFCRKLGLGPEDAEDVAQDALLRFVQAYTGGSTIGRRGA